MTLKELKKGYTLNKIQLPVKAGKRTRKANVYFVLFNKKSKILSKLDAKRLANAVAKKRLENLEVVFAEYDTTGVGRSRRMTFSTVKVLPKDVNAVFILPKRHHRALRKDVNSITVSNKDYTSCF